MAFAPPLFILLWFFSTLPGHCRNFPGEGATLGAVGAPGPTRPPLTTSRQHAGLCGFCRKLETTRREQRARRLPAAQGSPSVPIPATSPLPHALSPGRSLPGAGFRVFCLPPKAERRQAPLPKPTTAPGAAGLTPGLWVMDEVPGPKYLRRENTGGSYRGDEMQTEPWTPAAGPELGYGLGKRPGCCVRSLKPIHVVFFRGYLSRH